METESDEDLAYQIINVTGVEGLLTVLRHAEIKNVYGNNIEANVHATTAFFALGLVTNSLNVAVFLRTSIVNSLNLFLLTLSITDMLHLTVQFSHAAHYYEGFTLYPGYSWYLFYLITHYLEDVLLLVCSWLVCAVGIWRLVVVCCPLLSRQYCTRFRAKMTIILIIVLSILISCISFVIFTYERNVIGPIVSYDYVNSELALANHRLGLKIYSAVGLLKGAVPVLVIIVVTFALIFNLYWIRLQRKRKLRQDSHNATHHRVTVMLLALLILFALSNAPDGFMYVAYLCSEDSADTYVSYTDSVRFLSLICNSTTFFVYYGLGTDFRKGVNELLCRGLCCKSVQGFGNLHGASSNSRGKSDKSFTSSSI